MVDKYFYPLEVMRLRNDAGLQNSNWGATYGKVRNGNTAPHQGWDLQAEVGTPVFAVGRGMIQWVKHGGAYGAQILLVISRDVSIASGSDATRSESLGVFYAHLSTVCVKAWDQIKGGQMIGRTGISGTGPHAPNPKYPHLHFELRSSAEIPVGVDPFRGRVDPAVILGSYLLSCGTVQIGDNELKNMVCVLPENAAKPIVHKF